MEPTEPQLDVTDEEIDAAEKLRGNGEFSTALALAQEMLRRVQDGDKRMRLLFDVLRCSTQLRAEDITDDAIRELEKYPYPEFSRVLANSIRAYAEISLGRPQDALALLDMNLETGYFEREDFRIHRYQLCLFKGQALIRLRRAKEALDWLDKAHALYPSEDSASDETERLIFGWVEPDIQIARANCLMALDRFDESYEAASELARRTDSDLATLALQYMAECRVWQGRVPEALEIYADLKKRMPCRLVDEDRVETGIINCMNYLQKRRPAGKPS